MSMCLVEKLQKHNPNHVFQLIFIDRKTSLTFDILQNKIR